MAEEKNEQLNPGGESEESIQKSLDDLIAQKREELRAMKRLLDSINEESQENTEPNSKNKN